MPPTVRQRLALALTVLLFALSSALIGPGALVRAGSEPGSPPAPTAFGADTVGVLAAPGDVVDHVGVVWDEIIDPTSLPDASDFSVSVNGGIPVAPSGVRMIYSGFADPDFLGSPAGISIMSLDLAFTWVAGTDSLTLSYTPGANPVRDFALNEALTFTNLEVAPWDFVDLFVVGPVVDERHGRDRVLVGVTLPIDPTSIPDATDFTLTVAGAPMTILSVGQLHADMGMGILELTLAGTIDDPDLEVLLDYTPGANPIRSARDGALLDGFTDLPVYLILTSDSASGTVAAGGTLTTATLEGPTVSDPVATSVTSPTGGEITIAEGPVTESASGYEFFGQQIEITAPDATPESPIVIRFDVDASLVPIGEDANSIVILRNGVAVPDCSGAAGVADPDPCISERINLAEGDLSVTVLTSRASTWNMALALPYAFGGFQAPVNGDVPNIVTAGRAVPVKFSLGGFRGMDIFVAGSPSVRTLSCESLEPGDEVEQTVTAGSSSLTYDDGTDTYTYVWKTDRVWAGSCRTLILDFADGSRATATFDFRR